MEIERINKLGLDLKNFKVNYFDNIETFFAEGFNYVDLSNLSDSLKKETIDYLLDRYPRESLFIVDSISKDFFSIKEVFKSNLDRLKYYDCFFVSNTHNIYTEECFVSEFLIEQKKNSLCRNIGLKYTDDNHNLETILSNYPEVDFVELNINYFDYLGGFFNIKKKIDTVKAAKKKIIASNTDRQGLLSDLSIKNEDILRNYDPYSSSRSWALKFINSLPEVFLIVTCPSSKKELYDDIITIKYKDNKISTEELDCLKQLCKCL